MSWGREHLVDYERSEIIYLVIHDQFSPSSPNIEEYGSLLKLGKLLYFGILLVHGKTEHPR
jgi:hypothetical protein